MNLAQGDRARPKWSFIPQCDGRRPLRLVSIFSSSIISKRNSKGLVCAKYTACLFCTNLFVILISFFFTFVLIEVLLRTDGQFVDVIHTAGRWIGDEDVLVCYIIFINHQNMFKSHHLDVTYFPKIDAFKNLQ